MGIEFKFLPALKGDCIIVKTDNFNILIDGGMSGTYSKLKRKLKKINQIDLVILTHIDEDHILGLIKLFKDDKIRKKVKNVWFNSIAKLGELFSNKYNDLMEISTDDNSENISCQQGESLEELLEKNNINYELIFLEKQQKYYFEDFEITLLSPYRKNLKKLYDYWINNIERRDDTTIKELSRQTNQSSIAFTLKYDNLNYLFLGDADIDVVTRSLTYTKFDFIKVSHHGSIYDINQNFLNKVETTKYIILTNGSSPYNHPDKKTLDLIVEDAENKSKKVFILFNYAKYVYLKLSFVSKNRNKNNYELIFSSGSRGIDYPEIKKDKNNGL